LTTVPPSDDIRRITSSVLGALDDIHHRLCQATARAGFDAIVCLSPENVAYTSGFVVPSQPLMRWRHAACVLAADGRTAMLCVDMEEATVRAQHPGVELRVWEEFGGDAMHALAGLLSDMGLADKHIAMELTYLAVQDHAQLQAALPRARFGPGDALVATCRRAKTPGELALMERLSRIADRAIGDSCRAVSAGCTEMDIAAALTRSVYEHGAQQFKLMIVASGERSELPNVGPTQRVLRSGDVCRIEIFPVIDGYHAGVCRTAVVGRPSSEALAVYRGLVECKALVLEAMRPGVSARQVYEAYRAKFDLLGMAPISFVGHGIGLDLHEWPYLADFDDSVLAPGLVMGVEPLAYRTGHGFGMQIKDMVAIGDDGARLLSDVTDTAQPIPIPS
jgi:ectoine hydrolase